MGHKVHPTDFRLGIITDWKSRWFRNRFYREFLKEDIKIREWLARHLDKAGLLTAEIERSGDSIKVILKTSRPGLLIGRGGTGLEDLKKNLEREIKKIRSGLKYSGGKWDLKVSVEEIKRPDGEAQLVARNVALDLEKRLPFRRVLKSTIARVSSQKEVKGVKVLVSGRLDGSEMARREWLSWGKIPLQTLRANIDFFQDEALTTYGKIGVKVWIYKGEVFDNAKIKGQISK